jgi:hypothetical protein
MSDDVTSIGPGDPTSDGEPDSASSGNRGLGPVETFKDPLQVSVGETPSGIRHL